MSVANGSRALGLRAALWIALGWWIGGWALFAFVVAPAAFGRLPSTRIAGQLVGPVLAVLHLYGAVAGIVLAALAWALARRGAAVWLPLAMSALCLVSHFGVTAQIEAIRELVFGPGGSPEIALRFQHLHRASMAIYTAVGLGGYALVWVHARADAR
ncbi:MAG TPA: DUF4149 domain-containing protein [Myxococcota bacterium]|nr:DUF4149 domain-containing protein [Myxococcota bacterium]